MPDYAKYKAAALITNNQLIEAIRGVCPGFSKIQCSMINNPKRYGVQLTKEAETALADKFGHFAGLSIKKRKPSQVKRSKSHRLTVRLDEATWNRAKNKMQETGCTSVRSFLEAMIAEATESE